MRVIVDQGRIAGTTVDPLAKGTLAPPPGFDPDRLEEYRLENGAVVHDPEAALARVRAERLARIPQEAEDRIAATDWRLERARERADLGAGGETVREVMREREAIRAASNRAEAELAELGDLDAVRAFAWEVIEADYPPLQPVDLSRMGLLALLRQAGGMTDAAFAASHEDPNLAPFWLQVQLADTLPRDNEATQGGLSALEAAGYIVSPVDGVSAVDAVLDAWPLH